MNNDEDIKMIHYRHAEEIGFAKKLEDYNKHVKQCKKRFPKEVADEYMSFHKSIIKMLKVGLEERKK